MLMFEAFHEMYVRMRQLRDGHVVDVNSEEFTVMMNGAENVLRKHGKNPETLKVPDSSYLDEFSKL